jgi:hypothetical protein
MTADVGSDPGGIIKNSLRDAAQKAWDQAPATKPAYGYAPGQNAEEDARLQKELSDQQRARQKTLTGRASAMLSSFQNAQTTTPNIASRILTGY